MTMRLPTKQVTLASSAARTTAFTGTDQTNPGYRGVKVRVNITAISATPSVTFTIQGKDGAGVYYTLLASAAQTGTGTWTGTVYPGVTETANVDAADVLPRVWRVITAVGDSDSMTYSVHADLIP